jgi:hypothetical protein
MRIPFAFALLLLASSTAFAQVYKCPGAGGKMEYSDTPCNGPNSKTVDIVAPSFGGMAGGGDPNARALQMLQADRAQEDAIREAYRTCKFESFVFGDAKGKALARAAKEECINNATLKAAGKPTSRDAYTAWNDHRNRENRSRDAAIDRVQAAENARLTNQKMDDIKNHLDNKTYRCRQSYANSRELECQ